MVKRCYDETVEIVAANREAMDRLVELLIEKETMDGDEFKAVWLNSPLFLRKTAPSSPSTDSWFSNKKPPLVQTGLFYGLDLFLRRRQRSEQYTTSSQQFLQALRHSKGRSQTGQILLGRLF